MLKFLLWFIFIVTPAYGFTDSEIVEAIFHAEGGNKAQYPYGIRSVPCETKEKCKKICENTVKNNRVRYSKSKHKKEWQGKDFVAFLASRYAPEKAENDPQCKNKFWEKNVRFFLEKDKRR